MIALAGAISFAILLWWLMAWGVLKLAVWCLDTLDRWQLTRRQRVIRLKGEAEEE
jgi:hypothetical protein